MNTHDPLSESQHRSLGRNRRADEQRPRSTDADDGDRAGTLPFYGSDDYAEPKTLGAALRQTRLARQLKVKDVATDLHLSIDVINAMEEDAFETLGAPIYARSYLNRYAKLLGLPQESVLERYDELNVTEPQLSVSHAPKSSSGVGDVRWLLYPLLILIVGWLLWLGVQQLLPLLGGGDAPAAATTGDAATLLLPGQTVPAEGVPTPPTATSAIDTDRGGVNGAADSPSPANADGAPAIGPDGALRLPPPQPLAGPDADVSPPGDAASQYLDGLIPSTPNATDATADATAAGAAAGVTVPDGASTLTLRLSADCWVEVNGSDGGRLMYGLLPAGTHSAVGELPFSVILGNSTAAELILDGRPVAADVYRRERGVSRFVLRAQTAADG